MNNTDLVSRCGLYCGTCKSYLIQKKNLFKVNLADADVIYCYLNIEMMKKLENKFKKECKNETKIISYAFALPSLQPEKVIKMESGKKIYFYKI